MAPSAQRRKGPRRCPHGCAEGAQVGCCRPPLLDSVYPQQAENFTTFSSHKTATQRRSGMPLQRRPLKPFRIQAPLFWELLCGHFVLALFAGCNQFENAPREQTRSHSEKPSSKRCFGESMLLSAPLSYAVKL